MNSLPERGAGGADRHHCLPAAVHFGGHLRGHPAEGRDADPQACS
nr:hypothetical protein [Glutamicibacter creatinolyticus]